MHIHNILIAVRDCQITVSEAANQLERLIAQRAAEQARERAREQSWQGQVDRQGGAFDDGEVLEALQRNW